MNFKYFKFTLSEIKSVLSRSKQLTPRIIYRGWQAKLHFDQIVMVRWLLYTDSPPTNRCADPWTRDPDHVSKLFTIVVRIENQNFKFSHEIKNFHTEIWMGYLTCNNLATFYHVKNFANFEIKSLKFFWFNCWLKTVFVVEIF